MQISPYLHFNGQCREAFTFYAELLGGRIEMMMTHGESPAKEQTPPDWHDAVMHVSLLLGEQRLLGSDAPPEYFERPQGFSVSISVDSVAEADRVYNALAEGGTVKMPIQETFWSPRFGMLTDRFGTPWIIGAAPQG
jgi:PhnB protein